MADETVSFTINADTKPAGKALLELSRLINKAITADTSGADKKIVAQQREYKKLGAEVRSVFKDIKRLNDADKSKGGKAQLPFNQYAANEKKIAELENKQATITDTKELAKVNAELKKYKEANATMDKYAEQALRQILGTEKTIVADEKSILGIKTETANKTQETANAENNLVSASDKANRSMAETATNAQKARDALKDAENKTNTSGANKLDVQAEETEKHYREIREQVARILSDVSKLETSMRITPADNNLVELIRRYRELQELKKSVEKLGMPRVTDNAYGTILRLLEQVNTQIKAYKANLKGVSEEHAKVAKSSAKLKSMPSLLSTIRKGFKDWHKDTTKIRHSFDSMAKTMRANLKHLITSITKYVLGFRSLFFLIRRLRRYIGEGIKNMAQFNDGSNHVNANITRLLSSLLYLKNAWATAFSPILQFVTPWLEALIDKIAEVGNAFSRFLGSLLGQTQVFQAVKVKAADYADGLDNVGGSASGAADKTKKLTDRLAAFDDLNVLGVDKDPDKTGRGGGGGAGDKYEPSPNDMFKLVSVADTVKQKLAEMWENADFFDLGEILAQKIKMGLLDLNSRWPEIQDTANKVGRSFGTFLSGIFSDPSVFEEAGKAVAGGLNTIGEAIRGFFDTYQKGSIGTSIAEYFNGLFSNIDWTTAGKNVGSAFSTLFTEISSFFENLDYDELQKSLTDFFSGIDWGEVIGSGIRAVLSSTFGITKIASSIIIGLSDAINNTDFNELVSEIEEAIKQIDPEELVDTLATFLESVAKSLGASAKLIGAIAVAIFNLIKSGVEEMTTTFMEANDIDKDTEDIGDKIIQGVLRGITWALEGIGEWVSTNFIEPFVEAVTGKNGFDMHSPSKVSEQWGVWIVEGLKNGIASIINTVMEPFIQLQGDLATKWTEIKISASEKWTEIKDKLGEKANDIKSKLSEVWTNIKGDAATAWVMLRVSAVQAFEQLKEALKKPINGVISVVESMVNRIIDGINSVVTKINSIPDIKFTNPFTGTDYKLGFSIPKLSNISIPRLAQGAVIPPNREFMAVLGDQSHGTNVEAPLDIIKQAVAEVLANNGNAEVIQLLQQLIAVVERKELTIGDKEIAKANARYNNQQARIKGASF